MKNHPLYLRVILCILFPFMGYVQAWSEGTTYYARARAEVSSACATGAGTVYVNTSNNDNGGTYATSSSALNGNGSYGNSANVSFYAFAHAGDNFEFVGWNTSNGTLNTTSSDHPYNITINATSTNQNKPTESTIYAIFREKPLFYFSGTATATPSDGGTASVSPETTSVRGEHWNSTSATSTAIAFSATANTGYAFIGWSTTAEGSIVSTDNPYYPTLTSTSTTSGSPTNTTYYARFSTLADPTGINATDITVAQGTTITASNYTLTTTEGNTPYKHVTAESADPSIATVAPSGNGFTITGVGIGSTTISITAFKQDNISPACNTTFTVTVTPPESGVSGGVVTLNDLEDHTWSYYSDPDCPIRSLNPADVKITYYGDGIMMTGSADYTASSNDYITSTDNKYKGGAKVNVGDEDENTFIYYKTLERTDGSTSDNPTGRCPYKPIPNPFQVRPTYESAWDGTNTATWTGWRGFQCWRLKSVTDGAVYSAASGGNALSVGAVINAETEIYFAPSAEYGMAVELEAVWAIAYVVKANGSGANAIQEKNVGYERNFIVLHSTNSSFNFGGTSGKRITNINYPVTVSTYYPDGTQGANSGSTLRGAADAYNLTLQANTKFENIQFNMSGNTLTAAGYDLIVGRGCSGTLNYIRGLAQGTATQGWGGTNVTYQDYSSNLNYTIRIESGTINYLSFLAGYNATDNTSSDAYTRCTGTFNLVKGVLGCDYDRAKGETNNGNDNLTITRSVFYGNRVTMANQDASKKTFDLHVKSGKFLTALNNNMGTGDASQSMYMSIASYGDNTKTGERKVTIEGGEMCNIAGGVDVNQDGDNHVRSLTLRMTGGTVKGAIYGGGAVSPAWGDRWMVFTGGTVKGWIGAGCNGVTGGNSTTGGQTNGESFVYVGGLTNVGGSSAINGSDGGTVFGAGKGSGANNEPESGKMSYGTNLVIADKADILKNVYGGGNFGFAVEYTNLFVSGGTVHGSVFGGSNQNNGPVVNVTMKGGTVEGDVYGGSNQSGDITGAVNVKVYGGTVKGAVYGCNNAGGAPQNTVNVDIYGTDPAPSANSYALGAVFGGGNRAAYGGTPVVNVHNCDNSIEYVYGGGNAARVAGTDVTIYGGNVIGNVFGGGNGTGVASDFVMVSGAATTKIYGGTIRKVFAGNNSNGLINGDVSLNINKQKEAGDQYSQCAMRIGEVYGGGNMAISKAPKTFTIGCTGDLTGDHAKANVDNTRENYRIGYDLEGIGSVFGGANQAAMNGDISLAINSGIIANVFGGNNTSGNITGTITVNIEKDNDATCASNWYVGNVFGGGNLAQYTGSPTVNVKNGTVTYNVYGGGAGTLVDGNDRGAAGKVTGSPTVTIGDSDDNHTAKVLGDVYGGGDAADVAGIPVIVVNDCNTEIGYLYGGGNAADVNGTNITVNGGTIHNDAFGGGHGDKDASNPSKYADVKGGVVFNVYGGTIDRVFAGSNSKGDITGTSALTINKTGTCAMKIREAYGGGNEAAGNAGTVTIGCTGDIVTGDGGHAAHPENIGTTLEGIGTVYGGANKADIGTSSQPSNITLNINSGMVATVFGGNNNSGDIYGNITVNINKNAETCGWYVGDVFGGGNQAVYTAPSGNQNYPTVNILNGTVGNDVFGGGYGDANDATKGVVNGNPQVTINGANASVVGGVYGGGSLAPTEGNPVVTLTNGSIAKAFGGGKAAGITGAPTVNINGGSVTTGVYGGCDSSGLVTGDVTVNVTGGTVGAANAKANVHGGGYGSATATSGNVEVNIGASGTPNTGTAVIYGDVYGGSALGNVNSGTEDYTHVNLNAGTIYGDAYGGGLGDANNAALVNGNVKVTQNGVAFVRATTTDDESNTVVTAGRIFGCNNLNGSPKGTVLVEVNATTPVGGRARAKTVYDTNGNITTNNYEMAAVYGGGNLAAYEPTTADATGQYTTTDHAATNKPLQVVINGCTAVSIEYVYGGGNAAATPATDVVVLGAFELGNVFGGGNGKDKISYDGTTWTANPGADVGYKTGGAEYGSGESTVTITGGTVHKAFGGSNTLGNVRTSATVNLDEAGSCPLEIDEVYGGGNEAYMAGGGNIILGCITYLKEIYGGARNADVGSNVSLTITSGHFDRVFGGNNQGGKIKGSITVNIEETGCHPITIGELYGCGNAAAYSVNDKDGGPAADPVINIKSFTSIGRVFGGGLGTGAVVTGNPTVNINEIVGAGANNMDWTYHQTTKTEGGETLPDAGKAITLSDGSSVTMPTHSSGKIGAIGTVFGGGNAAKVIGNTNVNIGTLSTITYVSGSDHADKTVVGVDIRGNVYGGGNQADVTGNTNVVVGR